MRIGPILDHATMALRDAPEHDTGRRRTRIAPEGRQFLARGVSPWWVFPRMNPEPRRGDT